jgi:DNA-binding response OmpR family regulator
VRVLLIEGDQQIVDNLSFYLQLRYPQIVVNTAAEEQKAVDLLHQESPDLIFLDSTLPNIDTFCLISKIRQESDVPLLILSDNETDIDRARGLEAGVDEYISRHINPVELLARCQALLRRSNGYNSTAEHTVYIDNLTVNLKTREVMVSGQPVKLTPIEFGLLSELIRNEGRVVTKQDILDRVWGSEYARDSDLIKTYIYRLRSKLASNNDGHHCIFNEHGFGYRLVCRPIRVS